MKTITVLLFGLAVVSAIPHKTDLLPKVDDVLTYQNVTREAEGLGAERHLEASARYDPDVANIYHLFTRANPSVSQPLVMYNHPWLSQTNYSSRRRTIVLIHGWLDTATSSFNNVLVPAFLEAEDVNVIVVDWSQGAGSVLYPVALANTPLSGAAVARFISWLNSASGSRLNNYHIVGHGLGAHQAGIVGRNLGGQVAYITGLDPSLTGWITNDDCFQETDGVYTEVIHTNAGLLGYLGPLGHVDFYPNGGADMPGCITQECDSERSFHYFGESITSGGFTGSRCLTYVAAMAGTCFLSGDLNMGGIQPKTGESGIFYVRTNMLSPFSRG